MVQLLAVNAHQQTEVSDTGSHAEKHTGIGGFLPPNLWNTFFPGYSFSPQSVEVLPEDSSSDLS